MSQKSNSAMEQMIAQQADFDARDILSALYDEGIRDAEQVRDLIADYNALAKQYQTLYQKFCVPDRLLPLGTSDVCPACHRPNRINNHYCWFCGKMLDWG